MNLQNDERVVFIINFIDWCVLVLLCRHTFDDVILLMGLVGNLTLVKEKLRGKGGLPKLAGVIGVRNLGSTGRRALH